MLFKHSCTKPAHFFVLRIVLILLNSLNLSVVLMFRFQKYYSVAFRVINIWNSLSSDTVNASSISVCKHKLESVDFTPFVWWSLFRPVCFIVVLFSFVGHASVSFGTCVFTVQTFVYINWFGFGFVVIGPGETYAITTSTRRHQLM